MGEQFDRLDVRIAVNDALGNPAVGMTVLFRRTPAMRSKPQGETDNAPIHATNGSATSTSYCAQNVDGPAVIRSIIRLAYQISPSYSTATAMLMKPAQIMTRRNRLGWNGPGWDKTNRVGRLSGAVGG